MNFPNMNERLRQLQSDPGAMAEKAGYKIPQELLGDPKAMVQHLINTGQISNPLLQRIMPMIRQMGGK